MGFQSEVEASPGGERPESAPQLFIFTEGTQQISLTAQLKAERAKLIELKGAA